MKIAIEGMDGVGKSTIGKKLAEQLGMQYLEKPIIELFKSPNGDEKQAFNNVCNNLYALKSEVLKAWFFGFGNLYSFIEYENQDVIIDRHFASNYFWNGTERSMEIYKTMMDLIGLPDMTIVLYASWEVRKERIKKRDESDPDLTDKEKMVDGYDKMISFLNQFSIPYCVINTENKDIDTIVNEIIEIINKRKIKKKVLVKE